jgi:hypothetical protein
MRETPMSRRSRKPTASLEPISDETYRELFALIQNPPPGSAIEAAKQFGVDMFATLENLRLTPAERIRRGAEESEFAQRLRDAGRKAGL